MLRSDGVRQKLPVRAAYFRHVLPLVVGFPYLRVLCVIRHPLRMRWAFPVTVLLHLPGRGPQRCAGSSIVPCPGFPFRASGAVDHTLALSTAGTSGASQVLRRLSSCMPRPEDSGGPPPPRHVGGIVLPSGALKPSASAIAMSKLYQHFRVRGHPYGLQDALSTLRPSCSPQASLRLRHGRKTRYGWVARPYPTGIFTLQEAPSFAWRDNDQAHLPLWSTAEKRSGGAPGYAADALAAARGCRNLMSEMR